MFLLMRFILVRSIEPSKDLRSARGSARRRNGCRDTHAGRHRRGHGREWHRPCSNHAPAASPGDVVAGNARSTTDIPDDDELRMSDDGSVSDVLLIRHDDDGLIGSQRLGIDGNRPAIAQCRVLTRRRHCPEVEFCRLRRSSWQSPVRWVPFRPSILEHALLRLPFGAQTAST